MKLPDGGFNISDYKQLAKKARRELKKDPRQAAEKSYLAAVHAARQIVACAGGKKGERIKTSSWAIGEAARLLGQRGKRIPKKERDKITRALSLALGQHTACFYDGVCDRGAVQDAVNSVVDATRSVERACQVLSRE